MAEKKKRKKNNASSSLSVSVADVMSSDLSRSKEPLDASIMESDLDSSIGVVKDISLHARPLFH